MWAERYVPGIPTLLHYLESVVQKQDEHTLKAGCYIITDARWVPEEASVPGAVLYVTLYDSPLVMKDGIPGDEHRLEDLVLLANGRVRTIFNTTKRRGVYEYEGIFVHSPYTRFTSILKPELPERFGQVRRAGTTDFLLSAVREIQEARHQRVPTPARTRGRT